MIAYLPIAELSINVFLILGIGALVGFVSGMFGVGGGFLTTPLLIFSGVPSTVAITSIAGQIAASSFTGSLTYWRKKQIDVKLAFYLSVGGLIGSALGVVFFRFLQSLGLLDVVIAFSYVLLLGTIGIMMFIESIQAVIARCRGKTIAFRKPGQHNWFHGLPFRQRFAASRLYISILPLIGVGLTIGFVGAVLGIGGGFILVPAMIYLLKVPTRLVFGTSLIQISVTLSAATLLYAFTTGTVDVVLAILLTIGAAAGSQFGARLGQRLPSDYLRILLALVILGVALRFVTALVLPPEDLFSLIIVNGSR